MNDVQKGAPREGFVNVLICLIVRYLILAFSLINGVLFLQCFKKDHLKNRLFSTVTCFSAGSVLIKINVFLSDVSKEGDSP